MTETYSYDAIGNLTSKAGLSYTYNYNYNGATDKHAVTSLSNGAAFVYDANGNMTQRVEMSPSAGSGQATQRITYTQEWDVENKLVAVTNTVAGQVTRFYRDADGALVKKSDGAGTVMIVNAIFEHITATHQSTRYYLFSGQRPSAGSGTVAMRVAGAVYWLHDDHLGSASMTTYARAQPKGRPVCRRRQFCRLGCCSQGH